jgi:hypothetical protein
MVLPRLVMSRAASCNQTGADGNGWVGRVAQGTHDVLIECQRLAFGYFLGDQTKCKKKNCYRQNGHHKPRFQTPMSCQSYSQRMHFVRFDE